MMAVLVRRAVARAEGDCATNATTAGVVTVSADTGDVAGVGTARR